MKTWLIFFLSVALLLPASSQQTRYTTAAAFTTSGAKVLVSAGSASVIGQLQAQGARMLVDYGGFTMWRLPEGTTYQKTAQSPADSANVQPVSDEILLRGITLNPLDPTSRPDISRALAQSASDGNQLWLVQFIGPVRDAWLEQIVLAGLQPVAYLPNHAYVVWGQQPEQTLREMQASSSENGIQWSGPYHPLYRLAPDLRPDAHSTLSSAQVSVTIQFYNTPGLANSLKRLADLPGSQFGEAASLLGFSYVRGQMPASRLVEIAALPDVFNIESYYPPVLLDEIQGQIVAGNVLSVNGALIPNGPGYLDWLVSKGFPTDPNAYPLVDVVDDGLDAGDAQAVLHPDFYVLGDKNRADRVKYIANCTSLSSGNGVGGHGNLNTGIVAGYNNQSGFPFEDSSGYQLGLGISPYGLVASTKVFTNKGVFDISNCGVSNWDYPALIQRIYSAGGRISSNSWGSSAQGAYGSDSQIYDALTRDASSQAGIQEMLHIFAAGNSGPGNTTINAPGTAKNVLTVGASQNVRDTGIADGCYVSLSSSAGNIASFSSRGPTTDRRMKPELVAPGTHIQGPASQDSAYSGSGVCGSWSPYSPYYPSDQTVYTWSSGTSHSTPAVAGAAQLVYEYYGRVLKPGSTPSPAMLKALLLNAPRYLTGTNAGGNLPSPTQGWGGLNLGSLFDGAPRILVDQEVTLSAAGQIFNLAGRVADPARELAISLVWSDAPGNPSAGASWVNDLDLELLINGLVYTGNYFQGAYSITGGGYDPRNNVETIFLPPGLSGSFQVRVIARNIAGDGLPGNADLTDQDFALVISNGLRSQVQLLATHWSEQPDSSNQNGVFEPGETLALAFSLQNVGSVPVSGLRTDLSSQNGAANIQITSKVFPSLAVGQVLESPDPFLIQLQDNLPCGTQLDFNLVLNAEGGLHQSIPLAPLTIGADMQHTYQAAGLPVSIPDRTASGNGLVLVPLAVADSYPLADLDVQVNIQHARAANLILSLISPTGIEFLLSHKNGLSGYNYQNTIFDHQDNFSIRYGSAPFSGVFRPEQALSTLTGQNISGLWQLKVQDAAFYDTGSVLNFGLVGQQVICQPVYRYFFVLPLILH